MPSAERTPPPAPPTPARPAAPQPPARRDPEPVRRLDLGDFAVLLTPVAGTVIGLAVGAAGSWELGAVVLVVGMAAYVAVLCALLPGRR